MPLAYESHPQWGTGASCVAAPCDDSWAGHVGTLTSTAPQPVRNALGGWAPLRGGVASCIGLPTDACGSGHWRVYKLLAGRPCARGALWFVGVGHVKGVFASFPCRLRRVDQSFSWHSEGLRARDPPGHADCSFGQESRALSQTQPPIEHGPAPTHDHVCIQVRMEGAGGKDRCWTCGTPPTRAPMRFLDDVMNMLRAIVISTRRWRYSLARLPIAVLAILI
eukprot:364588-Chlamydomonas_euryale.AAC.24